MNDPVDHIDRPLPPWRAGRLTECGLDADGLGGRVISTSEAADRVRRLGQQRAAFTLCMTCASTADRHRRVGAAAGATWATDPIGVLARDVDRARWRDGEHRARFEAELRAVGALIEAHRDEFDGYLAGLAETTSLADARRARQRRRERR